MLWLVLLGLSQFRPGKGGLSFGSPCIRFIRDNKCHKGGGVIKRNVVYITWHLEGIGFNPLLPPFGVGMGFWFFRLRRVRNLRETVKVCLLVVAELFCTIKPVFQFQ